MRLCYQLLGWYETEISLTQFPLLLMFLTSFNVICPRRGWMCKWKWNALQKWSVCEHHWVLPVSLQWWLWGGSGWKDLCWWVLSFRFEKKCDKLWAEMLSETVGLERTVTLPSLYLAKGNTDKRTRWWLLPLLKSSTFSLMESKLKWPQSEIYWDNSNYLQQNVFLFF